MSTIYVNVAVCGIFVFKQKTAYDMRISDWSSDVCSSDLRPVTPRPRAIVRQSAIAWHFLPVMRGAHRPARDSCRLLREPAAISWYRCALAAAARNQPEEIGRAHV